MQFVRSIEPACGSRREIPPRPRRSSTGFNFITIVVSVIVLHSRTNLLPLAGFKGVARAAARGMRSRQASRMASAICDSGCCCITPPFSNAAFGMP